MTDNSLFAARNIINQIGDLFHEKLPHEDWVQVRQETNDTLDLFVRSIIHDQMAKAWDEGYIKGFGNAIGTARDLENPYREGDDMTTNSTTNQEALTAYFAAARFPNPATANRDPLDGIGLRGGAPQ